MIKLPITNREDGQIAALHVYYINKDTYLYQAFHVLQWIETGGTGYVPHY